MAIKTISQFPPGTPTDNDYILFEQNGEGKSATIGDAVNTCTLTYEEIMATTTDLTNKVASAVAVQTLGNNRENWKLLTSILYDDVVSAFETQFQAGSNYNVVTIQTGGGVEGGGIMFRHKTSKKSYGIVFSEYKGLGAKIVKRDSDGTWYYRDIL